MSKQSVFRAAALTAVLAALSSGAVSAPAAPASSPGPSMMNGYGMMMPWMMGPMMIGPGAGPAMMGPEMMRPGMMGWMWNRPALNLSTDDVKTYLENWIAYSGNTHIKVGTIGVKNDTTITADIVTTDKNGLVERFDVDRRTGMFYASRG